MAIKNENSEKQCAEDAASYLKALLHCKSIQNISMQFNSQPRNEVDKGSEVDADSIVDEAIELFPRPHRPDIEIQRSGSGKFFPFQIKPGKAKEPLYNLPSVKYRILQFYF